MKIAVVKETTPFEKRVALTPDVIKKLIEMGAQVTVQKNAGLESNFSDDEFKKAGASITDNIKELVKDAQIVVHVSPLSEQVVAEISPNATTVGFLKPHENQSLIKKLAKGAVSSFAMEMIPRISRAQTMDALSSQSNLAGYRAVIEAANHFGRAFPMMMTAAGTIAPARVLILGAGVAGLQAIATARRLGAIVSAFDVRSAAKEQVESLGASFVEVDYKESGEGSGGYAKEMSDDYKRAQADKLTSVLKNQDIVITTAQIPGKKAPILLTKSMLEVMKPGSVIIDLAVETGGNCEGVKLAETTKIANVDLVGIPNMPSRIAYDASQMYAKNIFNFLKLSIKDKAFNLNWDDEIIKQSAVVQSGKLVNLQANSDAVQSKPKDAEQSKSQDAQQALDKENSTVDQAQKSKKPAPRKPKGD